MAKKITAPVVVKKNPPPVIPLIAQFNLNGMMAGMVTPMPRLFSTGSLGYFGTGKVELEGKRYQVQVQLVEIGSKNQ